MRSSPPAAPQPVVGRRLFFLLLCLFGYVLLMAGWWLASKAGKNVPREPVSLLVVPFTSSIEDPGARRISEQLAPELTNALSKIEGLRILKDDTAQPASQQAIQDLGRKWKTNAVVSGSVSKDTDRLSVTARLTDSASGYQLWSQTYDSKAMDPAHMAAQITKGILGALRGER